MRAGPPATRPASAPMCRPRAACGPGRFTYRFSRTRIAAPARHAGRAQAVEVILDIVGPPPRGMRAEPCTNHPNPIDFSRKSYPRACPAAIGRAGRGGRQGLAAGAGRARTCRRWGWRRLAPGCLPAWCLWPLGEPQWRRVQPQSGGWVNGALAPPPGGIGGCGEIGRRPALAPQRHSVAERSPGTAAESGEAQRGALGEGAFARAGAARRGRRWRGALAGRLCAGGGGWLITGSCSAPQGAPLRGRGRVHASKQPTIPLRGAFARAGAGARDHIDDAINDGRLCAGGGGRVSI